MKRFTKNQRSRKTFTINSLRCVHIISPPSDWLYIPFNVLPLSPYKTTHVKADCVQQVEIDFSVTMEEWGNFYRLFMKRIYIKRTPCKQNLCAHELDVSDIMHPTLETSILSYIIYISYGFARDEKHVNSEKLKWDEAMNVCVHTMQLNHRLFVGDGKRPWVCVWEWWPIHLTNLN